MKEQLGLSLLSEIMGWDDTKSRSEFAWLRLMARMKYDGYRDFQAGMRFIESLACWLQQFQTSKERNTAYEFIRKALVYVGPAELQTLVKQLYPRFVRARLTSLAAKECGIKPYQALVSQQAMGIFERINRQVLYMGLSDGARIDFVRRANIGLINNEQIVIATQVNADKWQDLLENLRSDLNDPSACFKIAYLIDDFMGTGTSLLRYSEDKKKWQGKLIRFLENQNREAFELDWKLCVHHYIGTHTAQQAINVRYAQAAESLIQNGWISNSEQISFSFGTILPCDIAINSSKNFLDFIALTEKYYDSAIETRHTRVGGSPRIGLGYGACALPLVLEHNTPNNSVALLWAETSGENNSHAMRPLFRRRQRHS